MEISLYKQRNNINRSGTRSKLVRVHFSDPTEVLEKLIGENLLKAKKNWPTGGIRITGTKPGQEMSQ